MAYGKKKWANHLYIEGKITNMPVASQYNSICSFYLFYGMKGEHFKSVKVWVFESVVYEKVMAMEKGSVVGVTGSLNMDFKDDEGRTVIVAKNVELLKSSDDYGED